MPIPAPSLFLYEKVVARFLGQIRDGLVKAGDKLPSVRALSEEQGISMSTVFKAYVELENRGVIEARPKSGYYVKELPARMTRVPDMTSTAPPARRAGVPEMVAMIYENLQQPGVMPLSLSTPPKELIPFVRLNKSMVEALRINPSGNLKYESVAGNASLRRQVAKYAFGWGGQVTEADIVTTQGCIEALAFCLKAVTAPGDTIAIESPAYFGIFNLVNSLGLKTTEIPVHPETGIDIGHLRAVIDKEAVKACLFVPNFSNPVGSCMPDERKQKLVALLRRKKIPLIEDDIYGEIYFGKSRPRTCKSFDRDGWVMLCSSVSKSLAPGYRVGWCIPGRFREKVLQLKMMQAISSAVPTQAAIAHFFETGRYDLHMRNLRRALHTQCLRYTQAVAGHFPPGTRISRPQGGYALWIELDKRVDGFRLYQEAMKQQISIAPGQIFSPDGRFRHFIRISFGIPFDEEVETSLRILGRLIRKLALTL